MHFLLFALSTPIMETVLSTVRRCEASRDESLITITGIESTMHLSALDFMQCMLHSLSKMPALHAHPHTHDRMLREDDMLVIVSSYMVGVYQNCTLVPSSSCLFSAVPKWPCPGFIPSRALSPKNCTASTAIGTSFFFRLRGGGDASLNDLLSCTTHSIIVPWTREEFSRQMDLFDLRPWGVATGDRVALLVPNGPRAALCLVASMRWYCVVPLHSSAPVEKKKNGFDSR